jgi:nucleoside-diphosphate-sugar epimerase
MPDKVIVVTGAGGFIGASTVRALVDKGTRVRALLGAPGQQITPPPFNVCSAEADILDSHTLDELLVDADTVVHAAGPPSVADSFLSPLEYARVHVTGTVSVLAACRRKNVSRVVYISSAEVYGRPSSQLVSEDEPLHARSPYGAAKVGAEQFVEAFVCEGGGDAIILRPFSVYGPGMSRRSVVGTIMDQAHNGHSISLKDLRPVRDYCYISDVVDAVILSCLAPIDGIHVCNIGTGEGNSVEQVARLAMSVFGRVMPITELGSGKRPAGSEIHYLVANTDRAHIALGWKSKISLRQGLELMASAMLSKCGV